MHNNVLGLTPKTNSLHSIYPWDLLTVCLFTSLPRSSSSGSLSLSIAVSSAIDPMAAYAHVCTCVCVCVCVCVHACTCVFHEHMHEEHMYTSHKSCTRPLDADRECCIWRYHKDSAIQRSIIIPGNYIYHPRIKEWAHTPAPWPWAARQWQQRSAPSGWSHCR